MCLEPLKHFLHSIRFRLTVWYSIIFVVSTSALFVLSYMLIAATLRQRDHSHLDEELKELSVIYEREGLDAFRTEVEAETTPLLSGPLWVRYVGKPQAFTVGPKRWSHLDPSPLFNQASPYEPMIQRLTVGNGETLEVIATYLTDGSRLYVGASTAARTEVLEKFRSIFASVFVVIIAVGVISGMALATRMLAPLRHLVRTVQMIYDGDMNARVPLRHTGDELDELGKLFNRMLDNIAVLIQGMRQTLDNVGHDLRTPMTRLRGIAELALQPGESAMACQDALADCLEESERILTMLNALMDIAEAEAGAMVLNLEAVTLATVIQEVFDLYHEVAEDKEIELKCHCDPALWLSADRIRLQQMMANLLDNAVKYTMKGGQVELCARQQQRHVVLIIKDTGIGIPSHDLPHIWERLYRGDQSRSQRGLGLGLSLVRAIVKAHEGSIEVHSTPPCGSMFTLHLPINPSRC